jgi:hypothetical protein
MAEYDFRLLHFIATFAPVLYQLFLSLDETSLEFAFRPAPSIITSLRPAALSSLATAQKTDNHFCGGRYLLEH